MFDFFSEYLDVTTYGKPLSINSSLGVGCLYFYALFLLLLLFVYLSFTEIGKSYNTMLVVLLLDIEKKILL